MSADLRPERPDLRSERANLSSKRVDFRPERPDGGMNEQTDEQMDKEIKVPLCSKGFCPLWQLP